jgi:DNA repair protein RadC
MRQVTVFYTDPSLSRATFRILEKTNGEYCADRKTFSLYGSSSLSGVEHLRLLIGTDSLVDALLRHFGSLKALSRASFKELRQFLPRRKAEAVMAALSLSNIVE